MMRHFVPIVVLGLLFTGCASRPVDAPPSTVPIPPVNVATLVYRGCYQCLESAFAAATSSGSREQAFEVALLLASRSKELGLPPERWLAQAHSLLPVGENDWAMYLDIVETQQRDPLSGDRDVLLTEEFARRRLPDVYVKWRESLQGGPGSDVFRAYLDLTIACRRQQFQGRDEAAGAVLSRFGNVPLLLYRVGLCGGEHAARLETVRQAEGDLVDADLELGRRAAQDPVAPDTVEAFRLLRSARTAFPASPIVPVTIGDLHQALEDWSEALAEYDAALALVPTHRDALLGRTVSLSHLFRHEKAIQSATRMIDLGSWLLGQAHYWRAWNEYQLDRIDAARADADRAKMLTVSAPTLVLSGMINWREKRLDSAEGEFQEALTMDFGQCEAASFLGGVRAERRQWPESLEAFLHAQRCFELSVVTRRKAIEALAAAAGGAVVNARQIASHQRAIADAEKRREEAVLNTASIQKLLNVPSGP
jgi:tetratricopeptide (TPR) repeat protein